jgi:hypothetical protein
MDDPNPYESPETLRPEPAERQDGNALASGSPLMEYFQPPRLRILHLIGWMTAAAVLVRVGMVFDAASTSAPDAGVQAIRFLSNAITAASVVGGGILVSGWIRGTRGPLQPGHWLIIVNALGSGLYYIYALAHLALVETVFKPQEDYRIAFATYMWGLAFLSFVQLLIWYAAAGHTADRGRWKTFFGIVSATFGARTLICIVDVLTHENWLYRARPVFSVTLGIILIIVVALDGRRGPPRDWLHWVGVGIALCHSLTSLLWAAWKLTFG